MLWRYCISAGAVFELVLSRRGTAVGRSAARSWQRVFLSCSAGTIAERGQDEVYKRAWQRSQADENFAAAAAGGSGSSEVRCWVHGRLV